MSYVLCGVTSEQAWSAMVSWERGMISNAGLPCIIECPHCHEQLAIEREAQGIPPTARCQLCGGPHLSADVHSYEELRAWELEREARIRTRERVDACPAHDNDGAPDGASGFPTCSKCGAILTEAQGIPLIDVERAFIKGWYAAILYAIDEGGDPTSSIVARRQAAEYARLASESSRDHVARPAETHQEQQQRLRREEEDRL